jgi:putative transcriptional regulator
MPACVLLLSVATGTYRAGDAHVEGVQLRPGAVKGLAAGKLLIAARDLPDPNFSETVILLAQFGDEGAMGLIVNRKTSVPLARIFPSLESGHAETPVLFAGGPVAADGVVALVRSKRAVTDGRHIVDDIYMVASRAPLEAQLSAGADPDRVRVYLGYAGWAPGQLEREAVHRSWHVVHADPDTVFDPDPGSLWHREITKADSLLASAGPGDHACRR